MTHYHIGYLEVGSGDPPVAGVRSFRTEIMAKAQILYLERVTPCGPLVERVVLECSKATCELTT